MTIKNENIYNIGFDLGGSSLKYGYGNQEHGLVYFNTIHHQDKTLDSVKNSFKSALKDIYTRHQTFDSLCLASPGVINPTLCTVIGSSPNLPCIKGINLKELLQDIINSEFRIPNSEFLTYIYVENDANLMTYAESFKCQSDSVLGITIGSGIGTGLIKKSELYGLGVLAGDLCPCPPYKKNIFYGENYLGLEAGHMIVVPDGRPCLCGKKGCLEAYCSADSIKRIIKEIGYNVDNQDFHEIFSSSILEIQNKIHQILDIFAIGLSNLVMILNPGTIVLGGGIIEVETFDFEYLKNQVYKNLTKEFHNFEIKKAYYGNKAGVVGAIFM